MSSRISMIFLQFESYYDNLLKNILSINFVKNIYDKSPTFQSIMTHKYLKFLPLVIILLLLIIIIVIPVVVVSSKKKKKQNKNDIVGEKMSYDLYLEYKKQIYDTKNTNVEYFKKYTLLDNFKGDNKQKLYYNTKDSRTQVNTYGGTYTNLRQFV